MTKSSAARFGNYDIVVAFFCAFLLISNIAATKLIGFGPNISIGSIQISPIITDGGVFLFPLTYVLGDLLAEVYGFAAARRAIIVGFVCSATASATFWLVDASPAAAGWPNQEAWSTVLGFVGRIVIASLAGYVVGQLLNAWVLVKIKAKTGDSALWARLIGSTIVGEFADTAIFCTIAFGGIVSMSELLNYIVYGYLYKTLIEVLFLPLTYKVIGFVSRREVA